MLDLLVPALRGLGVQVQDLRDRLPTHAEKTFGRRDPSLLQGLVAHHSAGPSGGVSRLQGVAAYHVGPNHISSTGCPGICYTLAITDDGQVCILWDLEVAPWSQGDKSKPGDENASWLSVLMLGNFRSKSNAEGGEPSIEQFRTYLGLVLACRSVWGPTFRLAGHYDFGKPACPGSSMQGLIQAISVKPAGPQPSVQRIQTGLVELGYLPRKKTSVDGLWGPKTRAAVATFQRDQHLKVTGEVTGPTWLAMVREASERSGNGAQPSWAR